MASGGLYSFNFTSQFTVLIIIFLYWTQLFLEYWTQWDYMLWIILVSMLFVKFRFLTRNPLPCQDLNPRTLFSLAEVLPIELSRLGSIRQYCLPFKISLSIFFCSKKRLLHFSFQNKLWKQLWRYFLGINDVIQVNS